MSKNKEIKQKLLERIQQKELPVFYSKPIFPQTEDDPYLARFKFLEVTDYQTDMHGTPDFKMIKPICKSFK